MPPSPCENLFLTCAKSLQFPCSISQVCPSIASILVDENELPGRVIHADMEAVVGVMFFIAFQGLPCDVFRIL